jgi:hypothetical protein
MTPDEAKAIGEQIYAEHIDKGGMREAIAAALLEAAGQSNSNELSRLAVDQIKECIETIRVVSEERNALKQQIAAGQWNADMDAAPRDGSMIMVWCPTMAGERMPRIVRWNGMRHRFPWEDPDGGNGSISAKQPTHWRHLPAPPETDA